MNTIKADCTHCRSFNRVQDPNNILEVRGQCCALPPQIALVPGPGGQAMSVCTFPTVGPGIACGLFSPAVTGDMLSDNPANSPLITG